MDVLLDALLEHLPVFYYRVDDEGHVQEIQGRGARCLDDVPQRLVGRSLYALFPGTADHIRRALTGEVVEFESQGMNRDRFWWISARMLPAPEPGGGAIGLAIDVTEPKTAEVKMVGLIRENRALARRLVEIQEEERNLLARELHDELGQSLTAIRSLATAVAQPGQRDTREVSRLGSSIVELSARLYDVVRNLMHRLRPDVVDGLAFRDALQTCIDNSQLEAMGVQFEVDIDGDLDDLNDVVKISLYRILQESLTNIAKYAMASHVAVRLHRERKPGEAQGGNRPGAAPAASVDCVELEIVDDGVGMDPPRPGGQSATRGSGLRGMSERVHALGGDIKITSAPRKGVDIHVSIDAAAVEDEDNLGAYVP